ncbi:hypothetical protein W97_03246 [Coniosporium apollinis CBS 100218]|uniref:Bystin n=1 Tax=Coniosporium apollinis (strain CBS 100218) TaxID=1168221 RepID=R7YQS9_CONA1|nr:uncharacterized protein W97_03246 [Coniosporium apollinis CBS 100218]EON64016.1 hypothetical protein W97_03246 [Coniosporium apollinis CBS 100218]
MPKTPTSADSREARRHNPLSEDYLPSQHFKQKLGKRRKSARDEGDEEKFVDAKASRKILKIGQDLVEEEQQEQQSRYAPAANPAFAFDSRFPEDVISEEEAPEHGDDDGDAWGDEEEEVVEEVEIDPSDLETFNRFNPTFDPSTLLQPGGGDDVEQGGGGTNLTALILQKIAAHEAGQAPQREHPSIHGGGAPEDAIEIPAKVVEVYTQVGLLLSRYKSGKLPKPFKILPTVPYWETLLAITRPESWTPNACYEATKVFTSHKPIIVQTFLHDVLLDRVRDDIRETRKLNVHLYKALKKALYKPAAFFKGLLFPLVQSGTCTLREAHIVSSVLARVSVPVLHSAAALHRLCEIAAEQMSVDTESAGATNIFIRVLLEKKYALPYKVVDALVFHFLRFRASDPGAVGGEGDAMTGVSGQSVKDVKLPVLWHQCLLAFAQRYRNDITEDQREALLDLLLVRGHKAIGPEVRRELLEGRGRGVVVEQGVGNGGDDTMMAGT